MKLAHVLTGYTADRGGRDALALSVLVARSGDCSLTVAHIRPPGWGPPSPGRVDAEWTRFVQDRAMATLTEAAELAEAAGVAEPDRVVAIERGSGRGLATVARKSGADVIVIGSPPRGGRGRVTLGSTADQLLHSSPVPVALVPRGYAEDAPEALDRFTVAYRREPGCDAAVKLAAAAAGRLGLRLRLITLMIRGAGPAAIEEELLARVRRQYTTDLRNAARGPRRRGAVEVEIAEGRTVAAALGSLEWLPGELLICGSSRTGPLRRVFLGDTSMKIVRAAPRPVMILPRAPAGRMRTGKS
ncbi:universal stress protein [Streptosporangium sp. KLBMP 9127]|nr:universal stress protein [Streptosporangium sp. KLBMP 9127]